MVGRLSPASDSQRPAGCSAPFSRLPTKRDLLCSGIRSHGEAKSLREQTGREESEERGGEAWKI